MLNLISCIERHRVESRLQNTSACLLTQLVLSLYLNSPNQFNNLTSNLPVIRLTNRTLLKFTGFPWFHLSRIGHRWNNGRCSKFVHSLLYHIQSIIIHNRVVIYTNTNSFMYLFKLDQILQHHAILLHT